MNVVNNACNNNFGTHLPTLLDNSVGAHVAGAVHPGALQVVAFVDDDPKGENVLHIPR